MIIIQLVFMANNLKTLNKNIVVNFLENYGPNGCADVCVMWLMRKHHLYFQPFSQDVVRWLLLAFCKRELSNKEVINRMDLDSCGISSYQQLIDKLWCEYGLTDDYDDLWFCDVEEVQNVLRQLKTRRNNIEKIRISRIGNSWKRVYNIILPSVIKAKGKIFQEQFDLELIIKTINNNLNELSNKQSKEQYIETLFKEYSKSLLNRILTPIDRQIIQKYNNRRGGDTSSQSVFDEMQNDYRLYHLFLRYGSISNFERRIGREQHASNELLCMMTTSQTQLDLLTTQLGSVVNPLTKLTEAFKELMNIYNISSRDLQEKLGINIEIKLIVNPPKEESFKEVQPALSSDGQLNLPTLLDTHEVRVVFMRAIDKGLIICGENGKLKWVGLKGCSGTKSQLAYLCGRVFGYVDSVSGNAGKQVPYKELESLFDTNNMRNILQSVYNSTKIQSWRSSIDELVDSI